MSVEYGNYFAGGRTDIRDSVLNRSSVSGNARPFTICPHCGREVNPEWKVCAYCGKKLD